MSAKRKAPSNSSPAQTKSKSSTAEINYRSIFENAGEGIYQTTPDGKFLAANPAMARILGFHSVEELIRERTDIARQGYVQPELREEFKRLMERDGTVSGFECEVRRKDGSTVWVSETARAIRDEKGKILFYEGFLEDISARKKIEHELKLEQERFHFVTEATCDAIYDWNLRESTVWRNETYRTIYGATGKDRQWWSKNVHPDDLPRVQKSFEDAFIRQSHFWADEYRLRRPNGGYATVMDRGYIIYDDAGKPVRKIGAMTDITERKRIERALLESQALYHSFVEHLPASVFRKDYEGRYVFVNSIFCKMKGMKPEEILGKSPRELAAYEQALKNAKFKRQSRQSTLVEGADHHEQILKTGKPIETEEAYPQPDGSVEYFYVVKSPVFGPDGKVVGSQGFQFDITARKRAEEELFKSQQMLRTILDTIPQRVFWKDKNSVYLGCNKPLANDCGFENPMDLIGKDDYATKSAATAEMYRADDRDVMETRCAKLNYEEPQVKADGTTGWLRTSKVPLFDKDGKVIGVLGTYEDISERKRLEEQLRQAQKMDAFGQLAAGVAHDFNNILTVIQGNLSLLRMGLNSKADETSAIEQALAASERAANLTRQLLTFGRRQPMQPKPLDLNDVISNMTKMLQRLIGEHIALEARYAPGGAPIYADANMIEQVLINLAVNSRDAMSKGGKLVIEIISLTLGENEVQTTNRKAGDFVRFSITDNGCGIAHENLPHIFEPFFTTKEVGKGTGLGLATVFGIIQQHDGWIKVESEIGKGTTFHIFLPRLSKNIPLQNESALTMQARGGNENILLVEDELPVRELMRILLSRAGYKIHEAASGADALKLWSALRDEIDLLITDMVMPDGVSGKELAEKLRAEKPDLKIIYCSGYSDDMLGKNSPVRSDSNFLEKPFQPKKLLQRVRDCLDGA
jgi:two-component system cell cycle sensor histidine kinase/response regulator CckA